MHLFDYRCFLDSTPPALAPAAGAGPGPAPAKAGWEGACCCFHAWEANDSSLLNVLMPDGFPIAPQWISPILTAGLTATECLSASESAEMAPVRLQSCSVALSLGSESHSSDSPCLHSSPQ